MPRERVPKLLSAARCAQARYSRLHSPYGTVISYILNRTEHGLWQLP